MDRDLLAAAIVDRLVGGDAPAPGPAQASAVKALPGGGYWGGSGWYHAGGAREYDFEGKHRIDGNSVVALALSWIRRNVHKGRIVVGSERDDGTYEEAPHPLTLRRRADGRRGLLRRPNPHDSWRATLGGTSDSLCIDGYAYWIKARSRLTDEVEELYWVPNAQIEILEERDEQRAVAEGPVRFYRFKWDRGHRDYEPRDIVHFRDGIDPAKRYQGLSELKRQIRNAASIDFAERATAAILRNLHSGGFLAPTEAGQYVAEGSPDEAAMIGLGRRLEVQGTGENLGRIPCVPLPMTFVRTGHDVEELGLQWIAQRPASMLLAALGLNGVTVGVPSEDQSTYENKKHFDRSAWENGVVPRQDLIADEIEAQLLPDFPEPEADSVWWDRRDVEALREDANDRAARAVSLQGIATLNERRSLVDLPPVEGGDATPVEEAEAAAEMARAIAGGQGPPDDEDEEEDPAGPPPGRNGFARNGRAR